MKTVRQQILDMYSDFDLSDKKDFIKATVKQVCESQNGVALGNEKVSVVCC